MISARLSLKRQFDAFRVWAGNLRPDQRIGEWELGCPDDIELDRAFREFVEQVDAGDLNADDIDLLLYALARDNACRHLLRILTTRPRHLLILARAGLSTADPEARWQLALALGSFELSDGDAEALLEPYLHDTDEYVRRNALLALGDRKSAQAATRAMEAWETGHEYQRVAAISVLDAVGSPLLPAYVARAVEDGRRGLAIAAARSLNNLAGACWSQGKLGEAEELHKQALALREKTIPVSEDTAESLDNLALIYQSQSKYREAEEMFKRALAMREYCCGQSHPIVAQTLRNLAKIYEAQERHEEAEKLYQRMPETKENANDARDR